MYILKCFGGHTIYGLLRISQVVTEVGDTLQALRVRCDACVAADTPSVAAVVNGIFISLATALTLEKREKLKVDSRWYRL